MNGSWISEPATSLTDFALGLISLYCGFRTSQMYWRKYYPFHFHVSWLFYMISGAAFLGGIFHGFGNYFGVYVKNFVWGGTLQLTALSSVFLLLATLSAAVSMSTYRPLRWIPILAFSVFSVGIATTGNLAWVVRFYGPVIAFALVMTVYLYLKTNDRGMAVIAWGLAAGLASSAIWAASRFRDTGFPYSAVYHTVQTAVVWVIYRGAWSVWDFDISSRRTTFPVDEPRAGS